MNTQVGKSAGIALLLAAALIAALFAMGVFAPAGVDAAVKGGAKAPKVTLSNSKEGATGVTMTITFEVNDEVDASGFDSVRIAIPHAGDGSSTAADSFTLPATFSKSNVTVMQGENNVGTVVVAADSDTTTAGYQSSGSAAIVIDPAAAGGRNLEANQMVTVKVSGLTNPTTAGSTVSIDIGQEAGTEDEDTYVNIDIDPATSGDQSPMVTVFDASKSFTNAGARLDGAKLVVEFTARRDGPVAGATDGTEVFLITITPNSDHFTGVANATVEISDNNSAATDTGDPAAVVNTAGTGISVSDYDDGEKNTVTISGLGTPFGFTGDRMVKIAEATGYEVEVTVDGRAVRGPAGTTEDDDTAMVVGTNNLADAAVQVTVTGTAEREIPGGRNIVVSLPGFHIPDSIDRDNVIINGKPTAADPDAAADPSYYGPPESVSVSGSTITLRVPVRDSDSNRTLAFIREGAEYEITFLLEAGLRNPNSAGIKTVTVKDTDSAVANDGEFRVMIKSHIAVDSTWVQRGDMVEVTAKGINARGDATVHLHTYHAADDIAMLETMLDDGDLTGVDLAALPALDRSPMDGGTAILNFETSSSIFNAQAVDATGVTAATSAMGTNVLIVVDAGGNVIGHTRLGLTPKVTLNLEEVRRTGKMGVTVSDWYYGGVSDLRVNGIQVGLPDPDNADASIAWTERSVTNGVPFTVVVPRRARLGTMEVVVSGTTDEKQGTLNTIDKHVQTVDVSVFNLEITPPTAVTDQVIRIEGSGFGPTQCITSIMVGDERIRRATTGDQVAIGNVADCVRTDSDGTLSNSFKVPHNLKPNTYSVVITDALNRVGQGQIIIPKPAITLEPEASQRGSTVTVVGENFPAEDVVGITYGADPVTVATTDTVGKWRATFKVPVDATIGREYEVVAQSEKKGTGQTRVVTGEQTVSLNAEATHTVPEEILTVTPESVSSGQRLTITASNLPLFTPVGLTIGGLGVAGRAIGEDDASDGFGRYEKVLLVPQLTVGTHNVELRVHTVGSDVVVVTFVDILDIVTRPTNEVFADLIEAGQLASVWRYRIDETGSDWDSFDPQYIGQPGINDLETVSTRDIVWIRVTENVTFQGAPLFTGWNLRTLE